MHVDTHAHEHTCIWLPRHMDAHTHGHPPTGAPIDMATPMHAHTCTLTPMCMTPMCITPTHMDAQKCPHMWVLHAQRHPCMQAPMLADTHACRHPCTRVPTPTPTRGCPRTRMPTPTRHYVPARAGLHTKGRAAGVLAQEPRGWPGPPWGAGDGCCWARWPCVWPRTALLKPVTTRAVTRVDLGFGIYLLVPQ